MKRRLTRPTEPKTRLYHTVAGVVHEGPPHGLTFRCVARVIHGNATDIHGVVNPGLSGDVTGLSGDISNLWGTIGHLEGDITGVHGDVTGVVGNLNACELSAKDRQRGVDIARLVSRHFTEVDTDDDPATDEA